MQIAKHARSKNRLHIFGPLRDSDKHWRCPRELEGNVGEDFVLKIVFWLSHFTENGQYQALLLGDM